MKNPQTSYFPSSGNQHQRTDLEDAYFESRIRYSLNRIQSIASISTENTLTAIEKSLCICYLAGIDSKHHFKQIYIFDPESDCLTVDWMMSKTGFKVLLMQLPLMNQQLARWIWKLSVTD